MNGDDFFLYFLDGTKVFEIIGNVYLTTHTKYETRICWLWVGFI